MPHLVKKKRDFKDTVSGGLEKSHRSFLQFKHRQPAAVRLVPGRTAFSSSKEMDSVLHPFTHSINIQLLLDARHCSRPLEFIVELDTRAHAGTHTQFLLTFREFE